MLGNNTDCAAYYYVMNSALGVSAPQLQQVLGTAELTISSNTYGVEVGYCKSSSTSSMIRLDTHGNL